MTGKNFRKRENKLLKLCAIKVELMKHAQWYHKVETTKKQTLTNCILYETHNVQIWISPEKSSRADNTLHSPKRNGPHKSNRVYPAPSITMNSVL